jgi:hypothetical protein
MSSKRIALFIALGMLPLFGFSLTLTIDSFFANNRIEIKPDILLNFILILPPILLSIPILILLRISFIEGFILLFITKITIYYIDIGGPYKNLDDAFISIGLTFIAADIVALSYVMLRQKNKNVRHVFIFIIASIVSFALGYYFFVFALWPTWSILPIIIAHMQSSNNAAEQSNKAVTGGT